MANTPQAKKRARQAESRRLHNANFRSMTRTTIKKTAKAIQAKDLEKGQTEYTQMVPVLDRMATKGLISLNKASRHKSRLLSKLRQLDAV